MKRFLMIIIGMMVVISFVVPIYAFDLISSDTGTTFGGATFKPSNNVAVAPKSSDTEYVATSAHKSSATEAGFEFGIESASSVMKRKPWTAEVWGTDWPLQSSVTTSLPTTFVAQ